MRQAAEAREQSFTELIKWLQEFSAKGDTTLLPPATVPAVSLVVLADCPKPCVDSPKHFSGDRDRLSHAITHPADSDRLK